MRRRPLLAACLVSCLSLTACDDATRPDIAGTTNAPEFAKSGLDGVPLPSGYPRITPPSVLGGQVSPYAINDKGRIVGADKPSSNVLDQRPVLWNASLRPKVIDDIQGGIATAVNESGVVAITADGQSWWWKGNSRPIDLGGRNNMVSDMNEAEQVVGTLRFENTHDHAFLWSTQNGLRDVGTLGGMESRGMAINNNSEVVGETERADGVLTAFFWSESTDMVDIGAAIGCQEYAGLCAVASAINDAGQVVGHYRAGTEYDHAFLWTAASGKVDIPVANGRPFAVNDLGVVAGVRTRATMAAALWRWSETEGASDVDTICDDTPCQYSPAWDLNNAGHIVGQRYNGAQLVGSLWQVEDFVAGPAISLVSPTSTGGGLMYVQSGSLAVPDHGGVTVRITSVNPQVALVSPNAATEGASFVDIPMPDGAMSFVYYTHGLEGQTGTVTLIASAAGFTNSAAAVEVVQPAVQLSNLSASTTTASPDDPFSVLVGIPNQQLTAMQLFQSVRTGAPSPLIATVTSSNAGVGQLVTTQITGATVTAEIAEGFIGTPSDVASGGVAFDPLTAGTTTVSASIPGFVILPTASQVVTVNPQAQAGRTGYTSPVLKPPGVERRWGGCSFSAGPLPLHSSTLIAS
jgi:probable HAF family extracellular repeat protein